MPSLPKLNKDQIKKVALSTMGLVILLYVYFNYFLGPLDKSRMATLQKIEERQHQLDGSNSEISKAANLEHQAAKAAARYTALKALNPESAPIAWFPPRIKVFFANLQMDKANVRPEGTAVFKEKELADWQEYNWLIEVPQADFDALGNAIAQLENNEPLLTITKLKIQSQTGDPEFQTVALAATTIMQKR